MAEEVKEVVEVVEAVEVAEKPKRTRAKKAETTEEVATEKKTTKRTTKKAEETAEEVKEVKKAPAKKTTAKKATKSAVQEFLGTGKRKTSVARIRLSVGTGNITVNGKDIKEYFVLESLIGIAKQPLVVAELEYTVDIRANIYGGGIAGQAGAMRHGVAKALVEFKPELRAELKKAGFITRDARKKERKKYGLKKARKAPQFSKR
ncbi:MAG: 30S ribosomal protein S9 [Clostridia bacterium]|nr:30S ribosomal protein S9 [Clostridia bacterium]